MALAEIDVSNSAAAPVTDSRPAFRADSRKYLQLLLPRKNPTMLKLYKNRFLSLAFLAAGFFAFSACDDSSDADDSDKSTENTDKTDDTDTDTTTTTTTDTEGGSCMHECDPGKTDECGEGKKCFSWGCGLDAKQTDATRCLDVVGEKGFLDDCTRDSAAGTDDCGPGFYLSN